MANTTSASSNKCGVVDLLWIIVELASVGSFLLAVFGLMYNAIYEQEGHALRDIVTIDVDYGYGDFTYNYQFDIRGKEITNYTVSWDYDEVYDDFCAPISDDSMQPSYCADLRRMSNSTNYLTVAFGCAVVTIWLVIGLNCFCACKCVCCCSRACHSRCGTCYATWRCFVNLVLLLLSLVSVAGYGAFLYIFIHSFDKSKDGLTDFITAISPFVRIDWDNVKVGCTMYYLFGALACSALAFICLFVIAVKHCCVMKREMNDNKDSSNGNDSGNNNGNDDNYSNISYDKMESKEGLPNYRVVSETQETQETHLIMTI